MESLNIDDITPGLYVINWENDTVSYAVVNKTGHNLRFFCSDWIGVETQSLKYHIDHKTIVKMTRIIG